MIHPSGYPTVCGFVSMLCEVCDHVYGLINSVGDRNMYIRGFLVLYALFVPCGDIVRGVLYVYKIGVFPYPGCVWVYELVSKGP